MSTAKILSLIGLTLDVAGVLVIAYEFFLGPFHLSNKRLLQAAQQTILDALENRLKPSDLKVPESYVRQVARDFERGSNQDLEDTDLRFHRRTMVFGLIGTLLLVAGFGFQFAGAWMS